MAEGEVRYTWDGSKIDSIGGEKVHYTWDGEKIDSIGGEKVHYTWDGEKIDSIGGRSVHYTWDGEKIDSVDEKPKERSYSGSSSDSSYSYMDRDYSSVSLPSRSSARVSGGISASTVVVILGCVLWASCAYLLDQVNQNSRNSYWSNRQLNTTQIPTNDNRSLYRTPVRSGSSSNTASVDIKKTPSGVVYADSLRLRDGPGVNYDIRKSLKNGTVVDIVGRTSDGLWFKVFVPSISTTGWVSAQYIKTTFSTDAVPTSFYTPPPVSTLPPKKSSTPLPQPNTATPPVPDGVELTFVADQETIQRGQCTIIRWGIGNVQAIYLDGQGLQGGYAEKQICPNSTTTYVMRIVLKNGQEIERKVIVRVE